MEYCVRGRSIYPGFVVDIALEAPHVPESGPELFRAIVCNSGAGFVELDGNRIFLESPSVLCLHGGEELKVAKSLDLDCIAVYFKPHVINARFSREYVFRPDRPDAFSMEGQDLFWLDPFVGERNGAACIKLGPRQHEQVLGMLDTLGRSLEEQVDWYWPCRSRSYFLEFLFFLRNAACTPGEKAPGFTSIPDKLEDILLYLHGNYHKEITLPDLCRQFGMNRTSLNEFFVKHTGVTVIQYLINLRIRLAALLLRDTSVPVKELVYRTGFNDPVNFNRAFKKHTQYTPARYRKEFCGMTLS